MITHFDKVQGGVACTRSIVMRRAILSKHSSPHPLLSPCALALARGDDGNVMYLLTSPSVVTYQTVGEGWSPHGLLETIATASPPFHALIDTGALVTGMTNLEVARYLLEKGLASMHGVVFLDSDDRQMVLIRDGWRVMKLSQCGIPWEHRFAFYDQVQRAVAWPLHEREGSGAFQRPGRMECYHETPGNPGTQSPPPPPSWKGARGQGVG